MSLSQLFAQAHEVLQSHIDDSHLPVHSGRPQCLIFFSLSDGKQRALVRHFRAPSFARAWQNGAAACQKLVDRTGLQVRWLRVDWVTRFEPCKWSHVHERLAKTKRNYFRQGLALDSDLNIALLDQELNANAMLYPGVSVETAKLNQRNFELYLKRRFGKDIHPDFSDDAPVFLLSTEGVFVSDAPETALLPLGNRAVMLHGSGVNAGRRIISPLTGDTVRALVESGSAFLSRQCDTDGKFIYGHFPCFGRTIASYNALRHASTTYAMLEAWEVTRSPALLGAIDRSFAYLTKTLIQDRDLPDGRRAAFLVDNGGEIKLGGNAVCLLAFAKFSELMSDERYLPLMSRLAEGIAFMQRDGGAFVHVLNADDLSVKEVFRIIYYDGEAAFGLMRLYGLTREPRWLQIVERAFDHFIEAEHWKAHDHWLSYCVNELTQYRPHERYFRFGVENIAGHIDFIRRRITTYPTLLELAMAFHQMLGRLQSTPSMSHLLDGFDIEAYLQALHHRAAYLLNGFFWPEFAMYFAQPAQILGSFFIRHHSFRVRIDDVEHYLSGLVAYLRLLEPRTGSNSDAPTVSHALSASSGPWTAECIERVTGGRWLRAPTDPDWYCRGVARSLAQFRPQQILVLQSGGSRIGVPVAALGKLPELPAAALVQEAVDLTDIPEKIPVLGVSDTGQAMFDMATHVRSQLDGWVIGVTGSAGKTTLTTMMAYMFGQGDEPAPHSQASANVPYGVAWNLSGMPWDAPAVVLEIAIGDMQRSTRIARPNVAVFTNIGPAHLEYHPDLAVIARRKSRIFEGMQAGDVAVLNAGMNEFHAVLDAARDKGLRVYLYGSGEGCDVRLKWYDPAQGRADVLVKGELIGLSLSLPGQHMVDNLMACLATALALSPDPVALVRRLEGFEALAGRGRMHRCKLAGKEICLIDESYNANPLSMRAALAMYDTLASRHQGRRVLVIGDMLELGDASQDLHLDLIPDIMSVQPDAVYLTGSEVSVIASQLQGLVPQLVHDHDTAVVWKALRGGVRDGDVLLVKGSHGTGLFARVQATLEADRKAGDARA